MIGKMYRPLQTITVNKRRGFQLIHKYKSNFGKETFDGNPKYPTEYKEFYKSFSAEARNALKTGLILFRQEIGLHYYPQSETEFLQIEFLDLKIPLLVSTKSFESISDTVCVTKKLLSDDAYTKRLNEVRRLERSGTVIPNELEKPFKKFKAPQIVNELKDEEGNTVETIMGIKADMTSKGDSLIFEMPIISNKENGKHDWIEIEMQPIVRKNKEYMKLTVHSRTPVEITTPNGIEYV